MDRFQQTEERLQQLLAVSEKQSEAGMRLSSKDWGEFRKRLMRLWALRSETFLTGSALDKIYKAHNCNGKVPKAYYYLLLG
eukprot:scaffold1427_cov25-Prasinocladus_malaysianus.AAC.3